MSGESGHDLIQAVLRNAEDGRDGLELGNGDNARGVRAMDHVARIHRAQTHPAADGGGDPGIGELQLGVIHPRLVHRHRALVLAHQGGLGIHLLLGDGILAEQGLVTGQIQLGVIEQGLVVKQLALGLGQLDLIGPGIDFRQELPGFDHLTFGKAHPD